MAAEPSPAIAGFLPLTRFELATSSLRQAISGHCRTLRNTPGFFG
jgi:hypothetical protein